TRRFSRASKRALNKLGNSLDGIVERIALDRSAAGITDELLDLQSSHSLTRRRTGAMNDPLFDDRAVEIVGAETQRDLGKRWRQRHPIRFDMRKVVQHEPRYGDRFQIIHSRGRGQMRIHCMFWVESKRNKTIESACLILELAQAN